MSSDRISILMGRMQKLENLQSKLSNLKSCHVIGGKLPADIIQKIKSPEGQSKLQAKIDKAEKIRLKIAIAVYDDLTQSK